MVRLNPGVAGALAQLRFAIDQQYRVHFDYRRGDGEASKRTVWPLGLFFWGNVWTLASWCELRESFRNFRLDRMGRVQQLEERYPTMEGRTLDDMLKSESCQGEQYEERELEKV